MANVEIAHQFLLLPQCFQKLSVAEACDRFFMWERTNKHVHWENNRMNVLKFNFYIKTEMEISFEMQL